MKTKTLFTLLIFNLFIIINCLAQKHCDIALTIANPTSGEEVGYGDTITAKVTIKNLGPDTLYSNMDSVFYTVEGSPAVSIQFPDLNPGDSATYPVFYFTNEQVSDTPFAFCIYQLPYSSTFIDTNSVNDTSCVSFILKGNNTSVSNFIKNNVGTVFPNPATGDIWVSFQHIPKRCKISIIDMTGKVIKYFPNPKSEGNAFKVDISAIANGIYLLEIIADEEKFQQKIVVR